MHSSGIRTARLLTVSQHPLWPGGCTCPGGTCQGVYLPRYPAPVNRMTDRHVYKHNLRKLRLRLVKMEYVGLCITKTVAMITMYNNHLFFSSNPFLWAYHSQQQAPLNNLKRVKERVKVPY